MTLDLSRNSSYQVNTPNATNKKSIPLGCGYFFYTITGLYLGSLILLVILWEIVWIVAPLITFGVLGFCIWSHGKFPWFLISIPGLTAIRLLVVFSGLETEYFELKKAIDQSAHPIEVQIFRSLGIKNESLVLQGKIAGTR
jgi:hypothetical protein